MAARRRWSEWLAIGCAALVVTSVHAARPSAAGGYQSSYVLLQDGSVFAAGANNVGQLGNGTAVASTSFVPVLPTQVHDIVQIASGAAHALALRSDGTVWAWGYNLVGQLGIGSGTTHSLVPVQVTASGFTNIAAVFASANSSYAIDSAGRVWAWGANEVSQLGDGSAVNRTSPVKLNGIANVVALAPAYRSVIALLTDGTLRGWGENPDGQLGTGSVTPRAVPTPAHASLNTVVRIAATDGASYAVLADGTVRAWGRNSGHQLGNGATVGSLTPVTVKTGPASTLGCVAEIAGNANSAIVTDCAGTTYVWGSPGRAACLGTVATTYAYATPIPGVAGAAGVFGQTGNPFTNPRSFVYRQDAGLIGSLAVCGSNFAGELGTGNASHQAVPYPLPLAAGSKVGKRTNFSNAISPADVFWRKSDGTNIVWDYNGPSPGGYASHVLPGVPTGWTAIGTGDVTGDAISDVVWVEAATGQVAIWRMSGPATIAQATFPGSVGAGSGWQLQAVGDLDGDGRGDLVWRNSITTELLVWFMKSDGTLDQALSYGGVPSSYQIRALADVDGDWLKDIVWFQQSTGQVVIWKMHPGGAYTAWFPANVGAGSGWDIHKVGDFDGDGREDLFWRRGNGETAAWYLNGPTVVATQFLDGVPIAGWSMQAVGDYDGDGREDLLWLSSGGQVVRWRMQGRSVNKIVEPVVGIGSGWQSVQ